MMLKLGFLEVLTSLVIACVGKVMHIAMFISYN